MIRALLYYNHKYVNVSKNDCIKNRMAYRISRYAQTEMERRGIPLHLVESVLTSPQQIVREKDGRKAY